MPKRRLSERFWHHQKKHNTPMYQKYVNNYFALSPLVLARQHHWDNMTSNIIQNEMNGGPDIIAPNPGQVGGGQDIDTLIDTPQVIADYSDTSGGDFSGGDGGGGE